MLEDENIGDTSEYVKKTFYSEGEPECFLDAMESEEKNVGYNTGWWNLCMIITLIIWWSFLKAKFLLKKGGSIELNIKLALTL